MNRSIRQLRLTDANNEREPVITSFNRLKPGRGLVGLDGLITDWHDILPFYEKRL